MVQRGAEVMSLREQLNILAGAGIVVLAGWILWQLAEAGALRVTTLFERLLG